VRGYDWGGISIDGLENVARWLKAVAERPGVERGVQVPEPPRKPDAKDEEKFIKGVRNFLAQ
jgi:GSH-dependent disulfide-bond oxidoreductase